MKHILFYIFVTLICFSCQVSGQVNGNKSGLNNKKFEIELVKVNGTWSGGKWDWQLDEISFNANMLTSKIMSTKEKFPPVTCEVKIDSTPSEKIVSFKATVKNPYGSKIKWQGVIKNDSIEGTAVWMNASGPKSYKFSGVAKK